MNIKRQRQQGLTLIELMVAIALVGILSAVAVPSLTSMVQNNRQATRINEFLQTLSIARSEALKRSRPVVVCASSNQETCNTTEWERGWLIFQDTNNNQALDAGEPVLMAQMGFSAASLRSSGLSSAGIFRFDRTGVSAEGNNVSFMLCDKRGETYARALVVEAIGRAYVAGDADGNGVPDNKKGENLECP